MTVIAFTEIPRSSMNKCVSVSPQSADGGHEQPTDGQLNPTAFKKRWKFWIIFCRVCTKYLYAQTDLAGTEMPGDASHWLGPCRVQVFLVVLQGITVLDPESTRTKLCYSEHPASALWPWQLHSTSANLM